MKTLTSADRTALALQCVEELANRKKQSLLDALKDVGKPLLEKAVVTKTLGEENAAKFFKAYESLDDYVAKLDALGIDCVSIYSDAYPQRLLDIDDSPIMLFAKGNIALLKTDMIAVVGTRRPTRYGIKVAEEFTREFAHAGLTVASGLARGLDGVAHRACVQQGAPTVAVLACGLDICYPPEHASLLEGILSSGGLVISEYMLGAKPLQYHFPERNRIISGLSRAVLIPEAARKSGSLITARLAIEQGKDVFVVPGNIFSPESEGSNALLREMPHALAIMPEDVLDCLHISHDSSPAEDKSVELDIFETQIVDALHDGEKHFEDLIAATGMTVSELNNVLINLQLKGVVDDIGGNFYALA